MWLFTKKGFYSVVENRDDTTTVLIRGRVRKDMEDFRKDYLPDDAPPISFHLVHDYPYRFVIPKKVLAIAMYDSVMDIDYANFKDTVKKTQGDARSNVYMSVWSRLGDLEESKARKYHYWDKMFEGAESKYDGQRYFGFYDTPYGSEWNTSTNTSRRRRRRRNRNR
jgi:hypothetical protein